MSTLTIREIPAQFAHRGIGILHPATAIEVGIKNGDIVNLNGRRETGVRVRLSEDADRKSIHLDATERLNIGLTPLEDVEFEGIQMAQLRSLTLACVGGDAPQNADQIIGRTLHSRTVQKGDHLTFPADGGILEFQVESVRPRNGGIIGQNTNVRISGRPAKRPLAHTGDVSFADIGGLDDAIDSLKQVAVMPLIHPEIFTRIGRPPIRGVLLHGEPGTGKTLLAKALSRECGCNFIPISGPELMSGIVGDSEKRIRDLFERAKREAPTVIFIDEIDSIAPDRSELRAGSVEGRVVAQLLTELDGMEDRGQVVVIGATNCIDDLDKAIRRSGRFEREIECPVPDIEGRYDILRVHTRPMPLEQDVNLEDIARESVGFVGSDLDQLCREAGYTAAERYFESDQLSGGDILDVEQLFVEQDDMIRAMHNVMPSVRRSHQIDVPKTTFEDVIGHEGAKEVLRRKLLSPIHNPELHEVAELPVGSGVILHGPPGNGKTMLARAVANVAGAQFLSVKGPELISKWQGESEKAIRVLFDKARKMAPCVLFFDEFDSLGVDRSRIGAGQGSMAQIVNQLLTEIDGVDQRDGVMLIAATNRLDLLDPALMRMGRFGIQILIDRPSRDDYVHILQSHIGNVPIDENIDLNEIALLIPDDLSASDLMGIVVRTKENAIDRHKDLNLESTNFQLERADFPW
tara:strand:- start:5631 stop:7700 length:2070 start_codon:yes stop_codon:yes gene_type:complete